MFIYFWLSLSFAGLELLKDFPSLQETERTKVLESYQPHKNIYGYSVFGA